MRESRGLRIASRGAQQKKLAPGTFGPILGFSPGRRQGHLVPVLSFSPGSRVPVPKPGQNAVLNRGKNQICSRAWSMSA
jgi:hypothetical protein